MRSDWEDKVMQDSNAVRIRIHADMIRRRLIARNGDDSAIRETLDRLSDGNLVRMESEHHQRKLKIFAARKASSHD